VEGSSDCGFEERCESDVQSGDVATLFSRVLTTDVKYFLEKCGLNMCCLYRAVGCCALQDMPSLSFQADPCVKMEPENTEIFSAIHMVMVYFQCKMSPIYDSSQHAVLKHIGQLQVISSEFNLRRLVRLRRLMH